MATYPEKLRGKTLFVVGFGKPKAAYPVRYPGIEAIRACRRCGAWARSASRPCRQPVVRGRTRCWLHGGRAGRKKGSPGWPINGEATPEAKAAKRKAAAEAKRAARAVEAAIAEAEALMKDLEDGKT